MHENEEVYILAMYVMHGAQLLMLTILCIRGCTPLPGYELNNASESSVRQCASK